MLEIFLHAASAFGESSFMAGFIHPLSGPDHVVVMAAVGLWAFQIGGRARLMLPAAFIAMMTVGFVLAAGSIAIPFVEPAILGSLVAMGLLVALAVKLPVSSAAGIVSVFAIFHGHAHATQTASSVALYCLGFVAATALLHMIGQMIGALTSRRPSTTTA